MSTISLSGCDSFLKSGLLQVVNNWDKYNLQEIPAIIVASQSPASWRREVNRITIRELVKYAKSYYGIDSNNIVLMGHSMGGIGTIHLAWDLRDIKFSAAVIMSAVEPSSYGEQSYFANLRLRGYGEKNKGLPFFKWAGQEENFTYCKGCAHGKVPEIALTEDLNKDGISDLVYWMFGHNSKFDF